MDKQQLVREFMQAAGQNTPNTPTMPDLDVRELRLSLIAEELKELAEALHISWIEGYPCGEQWDDSEPPADLVKAADAIGDLLVVTYGAAVALGINIDPVFAEIHRSNMTKFIDGHRREDGKWIKGPSYSPARLAEIIAVQQDAGNQLS